MKKVVLFINEFYTTRDEMEMICYGLGSCIGLFIQDRSLSISSGAHIPVVNSNEHTGFKSAEEIFCSMLKQIADKGSSLKNLRAKILGGASIYNAPYKIGEENVEVITSLLIAHKIFIAAQDTGGNVARTAYFNSITGDCQIQTTSQLKYFI